MRLPAELAILLFSTAAVAQTQWVTATIDDQVVSWIWSITPSGTVAATTPSSNALTASSSFSSAVSSTASTTTSSSSTTSSTSASVLSSTTSSTSSSGSTTQESSTSSSSAGSSTLATSTASTTSSTTSSSSTTPSTTSSSSPISTSSTTSLTSSASTTSSSSAFPAPSDTSLAGITLTQAAAPIPTASLSDNSSSASSGGLSNNNTLLKIRLSVVISILAVLVLAIFLFLCLRKRRRNRDASRGTFSPVDQEKNMVETAYLGHGEATLPVLHTPIPSDTTLHMPQPTQPPESRHPSQDTPYEPSPIEPDHARNPFMGSQERLGALTGPAPTRGRYAPVTGLPTKHTMAISHELPAPQTSSPPISALHSSAEPSHSSRPSSDGYSYGELGGSGYGDLGLVGHGERYQDDPAAEARDPSAAWPAKARRTARPPSVVAGAVKPWMYMGGTRRSQAFYHPADQQQSFDFGFERPDSGIAATGNRKSPSTSVDEHAPMAVSPEEEEEEVEDEAGTGGMVPLGQASRTPPSAGRKSSLRRESLNDRLGSLRRTASVSVRRGSGSTGGSRFSIPRRPVGK